MTQSTEEDPPRLSEEPAAVEETPRADESTASPANSEDAQVDNEVSQVPTASTAIGQNLLSITTPTGPLSDPAAFQTSLYTGSAVYSYPIAVPPGTHGLQPQLALTYTSTDSGRAGIAGLGWDLTTSYVMRDTEYSEMNAADDTFKLVLNGQSHDLIRLQADGRFYTKIESDILIQYDPDGGANSYGGYWIVTDKSGTTYRFGFNQDSEAACHRGGNFVWKWHLDEVTDTNGNHIYYGYSEGLSAQDIGATYPTWIEYNNDRTRRIEFTYEPQDRPDRSIVYEHGCWLQQVRRLEQVRTYVDGAYVGGAILRYRDTAGDTRSMLKHIIPFNRSGVPTPLIEFTYQSENRAWAGSYQLWAPPDTPFLDDPDNNVEMHDVNRDGLVDIVDGDNTWKVYLNTGSGWPAQGTTWLYEDGNELGERDTLIVDVNNDGLPDIVENEGNNVYINFNTGGGWNGRVTWQWPSGSSGHDLDNPLNADGRGKIEFGDVNGDGLPDFYYGNGQIWKVSLHNGNGWNAEVDWSASTEHRIEELDTILIDVNSDGLADILEGQGDDPARWTVNYNESAGWGAPQLWFETPDDEYNLEDPETTLSDVNGDGYPDIVESASGGNWDVNPNNGRAWTGITKWPTGAPKYTSRVALADANGDGYPDIIKREGGIGWQVWLNQGNQSNLLTSVRNRYGGTVNIEYTRSTRFDNTGTDSLSDLGFNTWVVSRITRNNGMSGAHQVVETTNYTYEGGLHDYPDREFRGFNKVVETDAAGNSVTHYFYQDDAFKGLEYRMEVRNSGGNLFSVTENTYSSTPQGAGFIVRLTQIDEYAYDGVASNPAHKRIAYQYDAYGNVTLTTYHGDVSVTGDERYEYTEYTYNLTAWIVDKPMSSYLRGADNATVRESRFYYDGHANLTDAPTKGNITKQVGSLDTGPDPITQFEYDSYGNQINVTDPLGRVTQVVYGINDPTFTFPEKSINPLGQETQTVYDRATGNVLSQTDPNGYITQYVYDAEGRLVDEIRPYDSTGLPTLHYEYQLDGTAPEIVIARQRTNSGQTGTLDTYTIVDGFGRVLQTRAPAEDGARQIVTNTYYNNRGLAHSQSIPHFDSWATGYISPLANIPSNNVVYDALGREIQVTNPDGTSRTLNYDHWRTDAQDENGHLKRHFADAYGNIIRVDEQIDGVYQLTHYRYSPANELLQITDAEGNQFAWEYDSLGRQIRLDDPDMGLWTYAYDLVGNVVSQTDARGVTTTKTYDALNRPLRINYPTQTDIFYTYDQGVIGPLTSVTDAAGTVTYEYDQRLRPTSEVRTIGNLSWVATSSYDAADRVTNMIYPSGETVTFTFNRQGQIESVSGLINNFDYDAFQRITRKVYANGLATIYVYSPDDFRLQSIQTPDIQDLAYDYDAVGNVLSITNNRLGATETFTYDDLDRLLTASEPDGYLHRYTYSAIGNILSIETDDSLAMYSYGANAGPHAVTSINTQWRKPTNPIPVDGATSVGLGSQLCWRAVSGDLVTYDVYFGTQANPPIVSADQTAICYSPGSLLPNTTYHWQVVAEDNLGGVSPGPVWSFETLDSLPTETFSSVADTYTSSNYPTTIYGNKVDIRVKAGSLPFYAYLKFDTSTLTCAQVEKATLRLYTTSASALPNSVYVVANNDWQEMSLNWNNDPPMASTPLASAAVSPLNTWVEYDVTAGVELGGPVSFGIKGNGGDVVYYSSKEGAQPPQLVIEYTSTGGAPTAGFTANPLTGSAPLAVSFTNESTGCPTSYLWDFGDGATSTEPNPTHTYTAPDTYEVSLTVTNSEGSDTETKTAYITVDPAPPEPDVFISPSGTATLGGIAVTPADILLCQKDNAATPWTMVYDGSVRGTLKNITAFDIMDDGSLLLVFAAGQALTINGATVTATPYDVVRFMPNTPGVYPLGAGTFEWFFQGKPKGLTTTAEKIDAIDLEGNRLLLSTTGAAKVPLLPTGTMAAADEDVFAYNLATNQWESVLVIDGSKMPGMAVEDITSIWDDPDSGDYYITITGAFNLGGVKGGSKSIVKLTPNGGATVFTPSLVPWLASGATFPSNLDGLDLRK